MKSIPIFLFSVLLIACGPKQETEVSWSSLNELENLTLSLNKADASEEKVLLKQAGSLITKLNSSVPKNAKNKEKITVLLQDLNSLKPKLAQSETLTEQESNNLTQALSPIVTNLMTAAGLPHSCSTCASCSSCGSKKSEEKAP